MNKNNTVDTDCPIATSELLSCIKDRWGIMAIDVSPMPREGHGRGNWTFIAASSADSWFLKVMVQVHEPGVLVSRMLAQRGLQIAAPIASKDGRLWEELGCVTLLVYPFISGSEVDVTDLGEMDWRALGGVLRAVHEAYPSDTIRKVLPFEDFLPWDEGENFLSRLDLAISTSEVRWDAVQEAFHQLWSAAGTVPRTFFESVRSKGEEALRSNPLCCICHNDFHSGNLIRSSPGVITLIDWDNAKWAPPEADLMYVAPEYWALFERGYGPVNLNLRALEFVSANWVMNEFFDCAHRILFDSSTASAERQWALGFAVSLLKQMKAGKPNPSHSKALMD